MSNTKNNENEVKTMKGIYKKKLWKEYTAPNGKKYYYNTETKKTTWEKPLPEADTRNSSMQGTKDDKVVPLLVVPLLNNWNLIICSNGSKFYSIPDGDPQSELKDTDSMELLEYIDKEKLILLIGLARGYSDSRINTNRMYDTILEEVEHLKNDLQGSHISSDNENKDEEEEGFSSVEQAETNVPDDKLELNDNYEHLNDVDEIEENDSDNRRQLFMELLDKYDLDKFSTWRNEMQKIESDDLFYSIKNDQEREELFEEWCSNNIQREDGLNESNSEEEEESNDLELEPTKFHYLSHIVSKSNISNDTIFKDIKTQQKALFKEYKIKDFINSKKEQENFVSKLLFYYKKFDLKERRKIFEDTLTRYSRTITSSIEKQHSSDLNNLLNKLNFDKIISSEDSFQIETSLLRLEKLASLDDQNLLLANEPTYYILGIKDKTIALFHYLYIHYNN